MYISRKVCQPVTGQSPTSEFWRLGTIEKMASKSGNNSKNSKSIKGALTQEQIIVKFNQLRQEQRNLLSKINELEMDLSEHSMVIENLKDVAPERKCFRLVGGVLVERTVKDVLPALTSNRDQIKVLIEKLKSQLQAKFEELNSFKEQHNIRSQGEKQQTEQQKEEKTAGILVAQTDK